MVLSTTAAGTISQTARGFLSFLASSASEALPSRLFLDQLLDRLGRHVEDHALVSVREEPADHVGAHPAQSHHSKLHVRLLQTSE